VERKRKEGERPNEKKELEEAEDLVVATAAPLVAAKEKEKMKEMVCAVFGLVTGYDVVLLHFHKHLKSVHLHLDD